MQRKHLILIICGAVVALAILMLIIYLAKGGSTDLKTGTGTTNVQEMEAPVLNLAAYPVEETEGTVEISIMATIKEGSEIVSVTTPDGKTSGYTPNRTYTVSENGLYEFTVKASNGKETTEVINIQNIITISADNPYIPDGFTHIDGTTVDTGFVIEDKGGNQYVWIPVESGNPDRTPPSDKYLEDDATASALKNSVAKYYGFYIARYEASKETVSGIVVAKSIKGVIPWSNVTYDDAYSAARNTATAYNYIGVKTALANSYAWDTTLDWIDKSVTNYSTSRNYGNYTNQILETGTTEADIVNQIADMSGNVREWTTEKYDEEIIDNTSSNTTNTTNTTATTNSDLSYRVVRGGSATMDKIAFSRIGERTDLKDNYWGFRTVLYKE
ncbi:MAG: SUMF1/EgtB/PvdO family nonheme iron enzyme [Clostridia bacterium]|nr:SUMF1/EgtB/PvdO family nonheme iron enzyme [Clostridia bacterium]